MLRTGLANTFYVARTDGDGESLLTPAGGKGEVNSPRFTEDCRGLDSSDGANRDFWNVHALDLPSGDDGITFAIANFSYPRTFPTSDAADGAISADDYVGNHRGVPQQVFRPATARPALLTSA